MQIIIISGKKASHRQWRLSPFKLMVIFFLLIFSIIYATLTVNQKLQTPHFFTYEDVEDTPSPFVAIDRKKTDQSEKQAYYAKRIGILQAETYRLNALAEKLAKLSGLDIDFDEAPAQGGVEQVGKNLSEQEINDYLTELDAGMSLQSDRLQILQKYLIEKINIKSAIPRGKPVSGSITSGFGSRVDPFNGRKVFHKGIDFGGKSGSPVHAVADGIVSWEGRRGGYGNLIEIDHGNGYVTRYAHNKSLIAKLGDRVKKGQTISLMGSTGRSTGTHLHFELYVMETS